MVEPLSLAARTAVDAPRSAASEPTGGHARFDAHAGERSTRSSTQRSRAGEASPISPIATTCSRRCCWPRTSEGERLADQEVRDELVTLLLAGHETTATGLAWTFDLLLHTPSALERAREGDDAYLDAVVKEALRIRPVIPGVGRVVRQEPFAVNGHLIPTGVEINPSIRMIHRREDLYPAPRSFRPERFLGADAPDTSHGCRSEAAPVAASEPALP